MGNSFLIAGKLDQSKVAVEEGPTLQEFVIEVTTDVTTAAQELSKVREKNDGACVPGNGGTVEDK